LCVTLGFGALAAYNLENYRPVSNDEVELMAVGYKLATQGVLGSDLYAGFFGADQHFFITLPLQFVLDALSFRLFGPGVAQARWVSLVAGGSVVVIVGWLAYRWYGLGTALVCELLLVAWPSNLTAASNGLPLLGVARTARYDVLAVATVWFAIALLDVTLRRPRRALGYGVGLACGVAALSQFMGAFVAPLVVVNWLWARQRIGVLVWMVGGALSVVLPWVAYGARYADDVAGQLTVYGGRGDFLRPSFYLENVQGAERFGHLLPSTVASTWILVLGILPAVAYLAWRSRRPENLGDRIVWSSLVIFAGLLILVDQTKVQLYTIALLPSVCLALSSLLTGVLGWAWRQRDLSLRAATSTASLGLLLAVVVDGQRAYRLTLAQADEVSEYTAVGQQIERALPPGGHVLGPERWWWAAHAHPYLSLRSMWWQWLAGRSPEFVDGVSWADADSVIVNDNVRADVLHFPETVQQRFWSYLRLCTTRVAEISDANYFGIEVYRVNRPALDPVHCSSV
jgi:4-amino-4-deoxy-L-arabinose transferase-like glycosyltransferase